MTAFSWLCVIVLSVGTSAIFVWFLRDVRYLMRDVDRRD